MDFRSFFSLSRPAETVSDPTAAADAARDARDWKSAARFYRAALARDDGRADLWVQLGHALKENGNLPQAQAAYLEALARDSTVADTHLQLGHLLKLRGQLSEAAEAYFQALERAPGPGDAVVELRALAQRGVRLDPARTARMVSLLRGPRRARPLSSQDHEALLAWLRDAASRPDEDPQAGLILQQTLGLMERYRPKEPPPAAALQVVFDVSDLISYFDRARLPTGIQRVQVEVLSALMNAPSPDRDVRVCAFRSDRDAWVELPPELILDLTELSLVSGSRVDPAWQQLVEDVDTHLDLAPPLEFAPGAWLVNLGTSWWLRNYFLHVRNAQARYGIRYVPFVHDMIPVMAPEHCTKPLTQDFISWVQGVFQHAYHFLTNSEASRRDLFRVAGQMGHDIANGNTAVIRLDADFRKPTDKPVAETLQAYNLTRDGYILFVSTVESRKNHLLAFKALSALLQRHGPDRMPLLVCVGNRGWLNDAVFARLDADPVLRGHVRMLSGVADADLSNLYDASLFTLYPSSYEGWGLPVTEAHCHGKVALVSDSSSLPEAGGDLAVYFRDGDQADLIEKLEQLIFDADLRQKAEAAIREQFQARSWTALTEDIMTRLSTWASETETPPPPTVPPILPARFYRLDRNQQTRLVPGFANGEVFRVGTGWSEPDDWGCWTTGPARLLGQVHSASFPMRLFLGLRGLNNRDTQAIIALPGVEPQAYDLAAGETRWITLTMGADQMPGGVLDLQVSAPDVRDLALDTGSIDRRRVSAGVVGFMVCSAADLQARADFMEALTTNNLDALRWTQAQQVGAGGDVAES